jgi:hypothetical protein
MTTVEQLLPPLPSDVQPWQLIRLPELKILIDRFDSFLVQLPDHPAAGRAWLRRDQLEGFDKLVGGTRLSGLVKPWVYAKLRNKLMGE